MADLVNRLKITVDGAPLAAEVMHRFVGAQVEDSLNVPDVFMLAFRDPNADALSKGGVKFGSKITVKVYSDTHKTGAVLIEDAEVTSLEAEYDADGTVTVIRGLDQSHRLFRGTRTETYQQMTYSDIARRVAGRAGLGVGRIDPTTVTHEHVWQNNVSDWEFLSGIAREIGYEVKVSAGKLEFRKPTESSGAPGAGGLRSKDPLQLVWGQDLLRLRTTVTAAGQVPTVQVRSWDPSTKQALVGTASGATTSASLSITPGSLASTFGAPPYVSDHTPFATQPDVDASAAAKAAGLASAFAAFEGVARGNPDLKAGTAISIGLLGEPFDGKYTITSTRHVVDPDEGYTVWITVSGHHDRTLLGLSSNGHGSNGSSLGRAINGVVPALVTNINDPDGLCRVKVMFPWLSEGFESDWVRTVQAWAGSNYGAVVLPEVGDEVLVAFEHGDLRRPYVVGGLYNGVDKPNLGDGAVDPGSGKVLRRRHVTPKGHFIELSDDDAKAEGIRIQTGDGGYLIQMDKTNTKIVVTSNGAVEITGKTDVKIDATGDFTLNANKISMTAKLGVAVDAGGGKAQVKGAQVEVNGSATTDVKAGGILTVQGSLVKIN